MTTDLFTKKKISSTSEQIFMRSNPIARPIVHVQPFSILHHSNGNNISGHANATIGGTNKIGSGSSVGSTASTGSGSGSGGSSEERSEVNGEVVSWCHCVCDYDYNDTINCTNNRQYTADATSNNNKSSNNNNKENKSDHNESSYNNNKNTLNETILDATTTTTTTYHTHLWLNRLILCCFAIILLWMTSLQITVYIVSYTITKPTLQSVIHTCSYTWKTINTLKNHYSDCIDQQMEVCSQDLLTKKNTENERVRLLTTQNTLYANRYSNLISNYSSYQQELMTLLSLWTNGVSGGSSSGGSGKNNGYYSLSYFDSCQGKNRSLVSTLLDDSSTTNHAVYSTSTDYTSNSNNRVIRLVNYAQALSSYNTEYLHNKTKFISLELDGIPLTTSLQSIQKAINDLEACLTLKPNTICPWKNSLTSVYGDATIVTNRGITVVANALSELETMFAAYIIQVEKALDNMGKFYEGVRGLVNYLITGLKVVGASSALCGKANPDWCDFSPSDWFVPIPVIPGVGQILTMPNATDLWNSLSEVEDAIDMEISDALQDVAKELKAWSDEIKAAIESINLTPNDYNPPQYSGNITTEVSDQQDESTDFLTSVENALYNTSTVKVDTTTASSAVNSSAITILNAITSSFHLSWASFHMDNVDISLLTSSFFSIQNILYIFDYIYRIIQSIRLVAKFWARGVVALPKVDLRNRHDYSADLHSPWFIYIRLFLRALPFIWVQLLVITACIIFVIWLVIAVLIPEYQGYVAMCVVHTTNSTFLSSNLYAASYNYAYNDGNSDLTSSLAKYNTKLENYCSSGSIDAKQSYVTFLQNVLDANSSLTSTRATWMKINDCVNLEVMDCLIHKSCSTITDCLWESGGNNTCANVAAMECPSQISLQYTNWMNSCNLTLSSHLSLSNSLILSYNDVNSSTSSSIVSNALMGQASSALFNCSNLATCSPTCEGPNESILHSVNDSCSCMVEWFWNSYLLQTTLAILVYLTLNFSRILLLKGLVHILWRYLSPPVFQCVSDCDEEGTTLRALVKQQAGVDIECCCFSPSGTTKWEMSDIRAKLDQQIRKFEWKGWLMIVIAFVINILWIVLLQKIHSNIAYNI